MSGEPGWRAILLSAFFIAACSHQHWTEIKGPSGEPLPPPRSSAASAHRPSRAQRVSRMGSGRGSTVMVTSYVGRRTPGNINWVFCDVNDDTKSLREVAFPCKPRVEMSTRQVDIRTENQRVGFIAVIADRPDWFVLDGEAVFKLQETGSYQVQLSTDDDAILWFDDTLVAENRRTPVAPVDRPLVTSGTVQFDPGVHTLRLICLHRDLKFLQIQLLIQPPNGEASPFSPELF